MRNLLGPRELSEELPCPRPPLPPPAGVVLYWYDKTTVKPGRKMGHLCARAGDPADLPALREQLQTYEDQLWNAMSISHRRTPTDHAH